MQSWYSSDTLQIRVPFWYSFRFQLSDIVQIRSSYGCHSDTYSDSTFRYHSDTLQTHMPFWYLFKIQLLRYSSDTLQIRTPFWYSFRFNFQIQFRYASDTDAIMILIQIQLSDTVKIHSRYICHLERWWIVVGDGIVDAIQKWLLNHICKLKPNEYQNGVRVWSVSDLNLYLKTESEWVSEWHSCLERI